MINDDKDATQPPEQATGRPQNNSSVKYSEPSPAQRLRDLLLRANLSQRAGARELGVDERTVRYWCAGQTTPPRMAFLALERLVDIGQQVTSVESDRVSFPDEDPRITTGQTVAFSALRDGVVQECEISVQALEEHFGASGTAESALLDAFTRGKSQIQAAARGRLLRSTDRCLLTTEDF
jgi:DNA-binding transcriptional regulator YiaG